MTQIDRPSTQRFPRLKYIIYGVLSAFLPVAAVQFFFNPLGLGPEPEHAFSADFFNLPSPGISDLKLLVDGREAFDAILTAMDSAESSIYVQTYIWKDDTIGNQVVNRLKTAADREVEVRVRKDILGTVFEIKDMLNGRLSPVFTRKGLKNYPRINVNLDVFADTDHSKYFIVDHRTVIFGGMNIADEYRHQWHDYMVMIQNQRWAEAFDDKVVRGKPWPENAPFVVAVNDRQATQIRSAMIAMLDNARESVIIEHAYFSDDRIIAAVQRAVARRIHVTVILPAHPDTHLYANRATINRLLTAGTGNGIRIYLYPKMSHAKVMFTDGKIAAIGSANLTPRSMLTSREVTLFVHGKIDDPFIRKLNDQLVSDIAESKQVLKPFHFGFTDRVKALAGKYMW